MKQFFAFAIGLSTMAFPVFADVPRTVAAVNAPLAYIASVLGGGQINVIYPLPQDIDPAFWTPTPEEIQLYQQADLILLNGAGYASWVETAILPRARLVDTTANVQELLIPAESEGPSHKHGPDGERAHQGAFAFTIWLDPQIASAQITAVADAISVRWPKLSKNVELRAAPLFEEISAMDSAFLQFFSDSSQRQIFASHPVYQYLDRAYPGKIDSLHWEPDTDPGAQEWNAFAQETDADRRPIMVWEARPTIETRQRLEKLGVEIIVLSPMANEAIEENFFKKLAAQIPGGSTLSMPQSGLRICSGVVAEPPD